MAGSRNAKAPSLPLWMCAVRVSLSCRRWWLCCHHNIYIYIFLSDGRAVTVSCLCGSAVTMSLWSGNVLCSYHMKVWWQLFDVAWKCGDSLPVLRNGGELWNSYLCGNMVTMLPSRGSVVTIFLTCRGVVTMLASRGSVVVTITWKCGDNVNIVWRCGGDVTITCTIM